MVLETVGFSDRVKDADLVITGEGSIDRQTLYGKAPMGVAGIARRFGIPVVAVAGTVKGDVSPLYNEGFAAVVSICPGPITVKEALERAGSLLADTAERIMRLIILQRVNICRYLQFMINSRRGNRHGYIGIIKSLLSKNINRPSFLENGI